MTTGPSARRLTTAECWGLMEAEEVGRLAVTRRDGAPDIFPVNYVVHEGAVYVRSAPDAKVVSLDARPAAAFEIRRSHGKPRPAELTAVCGSTSRPTPGPTTGRAARTDRLPSAPSRRSALLIPVRAAPKRHRRRQRESIAVVQRSSRA